MEERKQGAKGPLSKVSVMFVIEARAIMTDRSRSFGTIRPEHPRNNRKIFPSESSSTSA